MIRVGFIGAVSIEWMGGLNYFKNLFYALRLYQKDKLSLIVFVGVNTDIEIKNMFKPYAKVIEDSIFDRKSLKWFLMKVENKIFGTNVFLHKLLKSHRVHILSHSSIVNLNDIKTINWIPDFQHIHLKSMFSIKEIDSRNKTFLKIIRKSDSIVLSSDDALKDFKIFSPEYLNKVKVLQFVSQPNERYKEFDLNYKEKLFEKYKIKDDFFYVPNQFWKHKNHLLLFKAINELKIKGIEIHVICTGFLHDYRNENHVKDIFNFIETNDLKNNIKLLGLVDYDDVFGLMKFSKAVINPSLFEGWSSTVEECKSLEKNMILSDLDVHKEQYPSAIFFKRDDLDDLIKVLKSYKTSAPALSLNTLEMRTRSFAENYRLICEELIKS